MCSSLNLAIFLFHLRLVTYEIDRACKFPIDNSHRATHRVSIRINFVQLNTHKSNRILNGFWSVSKMRRTDISCLPLVFINDIEFSLLVAQDKHLRIHVYSLSYLMIHFSRLPHWIQIHLLITPMRTSSKSHKMS